MTGNHFNPDGMKMLTTATERPALSICNCLKTIINFTLKGFIRAR